MSVGARLLPMRPTPEGAALLVANAAGTDSVKNIAFDAHVTPPT